VLLARITYIRKIVVKTGWWHIFYAKHSSAAIAKHATHNVFLAAYLDVVANRAAATQPTQRQRACIEPRHNCSPMKLLLSNNQLTRYSRSGAYATTTAIPLDGELALTAQTLLAWLQSQLTEGESVGQVFLEPDGFAGEMDEEGNATSTRAKLSAAVTAHAAAGSRSVVFSSEALPAELRDGLLSAWAAIEAMP
jgi:hypothetical protein